MFGIASFEPQNAALEAGPLPSDPAGVSRALHDPMSERVGADESSPGQGVARDWEVVALSA